jgi:hypothetical protein
LRIAWWIAVEVAVAIGRWRIERVKRSRVVRHHLAGQRRADGGEAKGHGRCH